MRNQFIKGNLDETLSRGAHPLRIGNDVIAVDQFPVEIILLGRIFRIRQQRYTGIAAFSSVDNGCWNGDRNISWFIVVFTGQCIVDLQTDIERVVS